MIKSHKYRIYPNGTQSTLLNKTFGCVRFYWNNLVASFNSYNKESNPNPVFKTQKELKEEYPFLAEVSATALQQKRRDFDETRKQYFNKSRKKDIDKICFKSKKGKQSYRLTNQKFKLLDGKIQLEKIGKVRAIIDKDILNNIKLLSVTISKNKSGQFFVSICFEQLNFEPKVKKSNENIGIDLGIKAIATLSDGMQFANPKVFLKNQKKLRCAQKHLSRKEKGSNRRETQRVKAAKIHQKITNQRDWYLHNISRFIVDNYCEIGMEDLNIEGMRQNRKLAKSISDSSMGKLKRMITYKQKEYGKDIVLLGRFEASTKECSRCSRRQSMSLSDRVFVCQSCGFTLDRDVQAAIVIRNKTVGVNAVQQTSSKNKTILHESIKWHLLRSV